MFIGAGPRSVARVTTSFGLARSIGGLRWVRLIDFSRSLATADSAPGFVSDWPYCIDSFASWVFECPVFVALAGVERAGVAAAHGGHDIGGLDRFVGVRGRPNASRQACGLPASNRTPA